MADTALDDSEIEELFDSPSVLDEKVTLLAEAVKNAKHFVVYTGAGISTAAGIPDFRGPDGVWTRASKGLSKHDTISWSEAKPTFCHMALVKLNKVGKLKCVISQNCDGLHLLSGVPPDQICELHGNCYVEACSSCGAVFYRSYRVRTQPSRTCVTGAKCTHCSTPLRYTTVAFGQSMPDVALSRAETESKASDLSLCMGTSMRVSPACNLPLMGSNNPNYKLVIVNLQKTPSDDECSIRIFARANDVMSLLMEKLQLTVPEWNDLSLHNDETWMTTFQSCYPFRSAGVKDWFVGSHQGEVETLKVSCPGCSVVLKYPEGTKTIKCPRCGLKLDV